MRRSTATFASILSCLFFSGYISPSAQADPAFFSDNQNGTIDRVVPGGSPQVVINDISRPWGVAVDPINRLLYWGDNDPNTNIKISRSNLDGTNRTVLLSEPVVSGGGTQFVQNLALDVAHNWIYYTEGNTRTIRRVHLDGTGDAAIVQGTLNGPIDIALDAAHGFMYWTEILSTSSALFRSNLDGTGTQQIFADTGFYYGLAVDPAHGFIYFADQHPDQHAIRRINLDGTNPVALISQPGLEPIGLDIDVPEGKLYWSLTNTPAIFRSNLDGTGVQQLVGASSLPAGAYTIDVATQIPEPTCVASLAVAVPLAARRRRRI